MYKITEKDLMRLSMILDSHSSTTRDRYICKFAEYAIFDSVKSGLSSNDISMFIKERFQLEFDLSEIQRAIKTKGGGRIIESNGNYQLSLKAADQISKQTSVAEQLKHHIHFYLEGKEGINEDELLSLITKYIYYCFNSNAKNFLTIIGHEGHVDFQSEELSFNYSQAEADLINGFLRWDNMDKNRLVYSIVSSAYEYCLITSNKNPVIPKSIFKNKKFFLDTNLIFRIAGLNKDERRFVVKTFVEKCREVGITLCYIGAVFKELYRVIDSQVKYIYSITKGQAPVDASILTAISNEYEINDFYTIYYNWCKEPQNDYRDLVSFRSYLTTRISTVLEEFVYYDSSRITLENKRENDLCKSLFLFKNERRKNKNTTDESVKTDITQIVFLEKMRPRMSKSLWDMNEFIVSADQLLISWADAQFDGIPLVVIPSLWLSIILKVTGRATEDDYQSFCMFMSLRHFRSDDGLVINPTELLSRLSNKTIDCQIKEWVISEIITNKNDYTFSNLEDYDISIEKAFDRLLQQNEKIHNEELIKAVDSERQKAIEAEQHYKSEILTKKTYEEYAQEFARKKAQTKIDKYSRKAYVPLLFGGLAILTVILIILSFIFKISPFYHWLCWIITTDSINNKIWSALTWLVNLFVITIPAYCKQVWEYLSSDKRRDKLCSKYFKQQLKVMNRKQ